MYKTDMSKLTYSNRDWWKWGEADKRKRLDDFPKLKKDFIQRFGNHFETLVPSPDIKIEAESNEKVVQLFKKELPVIDIKTDIETRLLRATGKSYFDLLRAYHPELIKLPDAVIKPNTQTELAQVIRWADNHQVIIVPFGGGTNVVGAFAPKASQKGHFTLDLSSLNGLVGFDKENQIATFEAGITGPQLEAKLKERGYTMGHFPQSFEYSTLGGWVVTHSAGQESSHYGNIDNIVLGLKVITPAGTIHTNHYESDADGIDLKALFLGSEGLLGVVSEVQVKIHPIPKTKKWVTAIFPSFSQGTQALKTITRNGLEPSVVRYSDALETDFLLKAADEGSSFFKELKSIAIQSFFKLKRWKEPTILMIRFDGEPELAHLRAKMAETVITKNKGFLTGEGLGKKWENSRYGLPYMRDDLVERGLVVDTMETILPWSKIQETKEALLRNLQESEAFGKKNGILLAHLSHVYSTSSCIYFTVITQMNRKNAVAQWHEIKNIVTDTITQHGGAVSHHHSIGTELQKWYLQNTDELSKKVLQAVKKVLDPNSIMNPGKLFDE